MPTLIHGHTVCAQSFFFVADLFATGVRRSQGRKERLQLHAFFCEVSVLHARVQGCSSLMRGKTTGKVLRASPDLAVAPSYLRELEDENVAFADLPTMLDLGMNRVDVRLFAAIVGACPKNIKGRRALENDTSAGCFRMWQTNIASVG